MPIIYSENPENLRDFYENYLGFELHHKLDIPKDSEKGTEADYGYVYKTGDFKFFVGKHSEVKGFNQEKFRHIFNFYVENVFEAFEKVKNAPGITIIQPPFVTPDSTDEKPRHVCTFLDPEGNCWQYMEKKRE